MKKYPVFFAGLLAVFALAILSFGKKGGDVFEIYLNGNQVHQQFVHMDKSTKTLHLTPLSGNDKFDVYYSHCGTSGKARVLTIRNEKNELIKELKFADAKEGKSLMSFYWRDITSQKIKAEKFNLIYSSKELPEGKALATISGRGTKTLAKL